MSAAVSSPLSPFRPPKFPIRSLPISNRQVQPRVQNNNYAAGQRVYNNSGGHAMDPHGYGPSPNGQHFGGRHAGPSSQHQNNAPQAPGAIGADVGPVAGPKGKHKPTHLNPNSVDFIPAGVVPPVAPSPPSTTSTSSGTGLPVAIGAGLQPVGLTPIGLTPDEPNMEEPAFKVSEESVKNRRYSTEEMRGLKRCEDHCPKGLLQLVLSGELFSGLTPAGKLYQQRAAAANATAQESGFDRNIFGNAASAGLDKAAAMRLRVVKETHHKVMSVLSRVTPEKYEALKSELMDLPLRQTDENQLKKVVEVFFEKAVQEPVYSQLYAALVAHMCHVSETDRALPKEEKDKLFSFRMRRELLNKCQEEFNKPCTNTVEEMADLDEEAIEDLRRRQKKRLCGNIKFVCELYARNLVTDRVIDSILTTLVSLNSTEAYVAEAIATTLESAGTIFSKTQPESFENHMQYCIGLQKTHPSARIRFLMMDLDDARKKGFEKKKKVMTQEELDRQQMKDQRKLQDDIDKALKEQTRKNEASRRTKKTTSTGNGNGATVINNTPSSVPQSPMSPAPRSAKGRGAEPRETKKDARLFDRAAEMPATPTSTGPASSSMMQTPNSTGSTPQFYRGNMSQLASTTSLSSLGHASITSGAVLSKEQVENTARELMTAMAVGDVSVENIVGKFEEDLVEKHQKTAILIGWLRRAVATTKLFTEREQLPKLFSEFLVAIDRSAGAPFSVAELSKALNDWAIYDIDCQQYDNCPRMFLNWASVVEMAAQHESPSPDGVSITDPATVIHPGTLNLFLQELRKHSGSSSCMESLTKDVLPTLDNATEANLTKLTQITVAQAMNTGLEVSDRMLPLMQRFRPAAHLAYIEAVEAPAAAAEEVLAKMLQNPKIKDDLELNAYKLLLTGAISTMTEDLKLLVAKNPSKLGPLHKLMKVSSAAVAVVLPHHANTLQGSKTFAMTTVTAERAEAVVKALKAQFQRSVEALDLGSTAAEHLAGLVTLSETMQHCALAVSATTDRSVPASPTMPQSPNLPMPRSASSSQLMLAQLDFESNFSSNITTKLTEVLVTAADTKFVGSDTRSHLATTLEDLAFDVFAVSPPCSLRPVPPTPSMDTADCSPNDSPVKGGGHRSCTPDPQAPMTHARTLGASLRQGLLVE